MLILGHRAGQGADGGAAPCAGAVRLSEHVAGDGPAAATARALLDNVWVADDLAAVPESFAGVTVTTAGRVWSGRTRELRQTAKVGEERVLAERNRRDQLIAATESTAGAEHEARNAVERAAAHRGGTRRGA